MLRARVPGLILVAVAGYELRNLLLGLGAVVSVIDAAHVSASLAPAALLALGLAAMLGQLGRGLGRVARVPRWALALLAVWLLLGSVLVVLLSATRLLDSQMLSGHLLGPEGVWTSASSVLALGLMASASIQGGRWLTRQRHLGAELLIDAPARDPVHTRRVTSDPQPGPPPLLAGWSGRGPPHVSSAPI